MKLYISTYKVINKVAQNFHFLTIKFKLHIYIFHITAVTRKYVD